MKYRIKVRSRHPSHNIFRTNLPKLPFTCVVRFGSTTPVENCSIEINKVHVARISGNKKEMKKIFDSVNASTAPWGIIKSISQILVNDTFYTPSELFQLFKERVILKHIHGSRGRGNYFFTDLKSFTDTLTTLPRLANYIVEEYKPYDKEYRLHVTQEGCFYACRKMLKKDTPDNDRWRRHDDNCIWYMETNPEFKKPSTWDRIVADCVNVLKQMDADFLAFDIKVQKRKPENYILIESNSAPSMGDVTAEKYLQEIPKIAIRKQQLCVE